jgi:hypothetical protein
MGNKQSVSPFRAYEIASSLYSKEQLTEISDNFRKIASNRDVLDIDIFTANCRGKTSDFTRRHILPRFFSAIDVNRDGIIDFEDFLCAKTLFRNGTLDEKAKFVVLMYGTESSITRLNLNRLLLDVMSPRSDEGGNVNFYADWGNDLTSLLEVMSDMVFVQVCNVL